MEFSTQYADRTEALVALFTSVFSASEGASEGRSIGELASNLFTKTPNDDIHVFSAFENGDPIGCIIFSRLTYDDDPRNVFVLGPVAVRTDQQGKGVGQALLNHGLEALRNLGVDVAITYGDPKYYSKVGFRQITEADAKPPLTLQFPNGWLGQSLTSDTLEPLKGPSRCVQAFNRPEYW